MNVALFDHSTIESLRWPDSEDGHYARNFLKPFVQHGTKRYIDNVDAEVMALQVDDLVLPVVVVDEEYDNSYVCSPYGHYIANAMESNHLVERPLLRALSKHFMGGLGQLLRRGRINAVVFVNNWLFSTDLYPTGITEKHISAILSLLKERFPKHAIIFRSLNALTAPDLLRHLQQQDFKMIASRQVYVTDTKCDEVYRKRDIKRDLKLWKESSYQVLDQDQIAPEEYPQVLALYRQVFIDHHSDLNPQFTDSFIELALTQNLLRVKALKNQGRLCGVVGYFERGGVLMCPLLGYDKNHPDHLNLYRLLCTAMFLDAKDRGVILHHSAGASSFKKNRGAEGFLESMAVYTRHLPTRQRLSWSVLKTFINTFAVPYMQKY